MEQKKTEKKKANSFFRRLANIGVGMTILEKDYVARFVSDVESDKIKETIRNAQSVINREIRYKIHQPIGCYTKFEMSNLVVSLSEEEEKHSSEIFEPFITKGYTVTPLSNYEPFAGYDVYLISWKQ